MPTKLHPDLSLRPLTDEEVEDEEDKEDKEVEDDLLQTSAQPRAQHQDMSQSFDIPANVQFQILKHFFNFKGSVVHAISRLDPYHPITQVPLNRFGKPSYLHRLHVGRSKVSITLSPSRASS